MILYAILYWRSSASSFGLMILAVVMWAARKVPAFVAISGNWIGKNRRFNRREMVPVDDAARPSRDELRRRGDAVEDDSFESTANTAAIDEERQAGSPVPTAARRATRRSRNFDDPPNPADAVRKGWTFTHWPTRHSG